MVRQVHHAHVHADRAALRDRPAGNPVAALAGAQPRQSVGIAGGDDAHAGRPLRLKAPAVADKGPGLVDLDGADRRHQPHGGLQAQLPVVPVAVQQQARPDHVQQALGIVHHCPAVGTVADRKADPLLLLQPADHPGEKFELRLRIGPAFRVRLVRNGEMGIDPFVFQIRQRAGPHDVAHAFVKIAPGAEIAEARHPGVQLDVQLQDPAEPPRLFGILLRLGKAGRRLGQPVLQQHRRVFHRRVPEDQNRHRDAAPAKLQRLVQAAHGEIVRAFPLQQL